MSQELTDRHLGDDDLHSHKYPKDSHCKVKLKLFFLVDPTWKSWTPTVCNGYHDEFI